jgi:cation transport ATPase
MSDSLPDVNTVAKTARTYAKDLAERVIWSFLGGTIAVVVAAGPADMLHADFWKAAGVGGLTAVVALVKGLAARGIGAKNSASTAPGV